jgi:RimJ/RimL family protein N-acetyltransferase
MQEPLTPTEKAKQILKWRARFDLGQELFYGIFDRDERMAIGGTGTHVRIGAGAREIGYWVRADCTRQGFATESAAALTRVGFELQRLRLIEIHCDPRNLASAAVPRKLGYVNQVTIKNCVPNLQTGPRDSAVWSMSRSNYSGSPASSVAIEMFDACDETILLTPEVAWAKLT